SVSSSSPGGALRREANRSHLLRSHGGLCARRRECLKVGAFVLDVQQRRRAGRIGIVRLDRLVDADVICQCGWRMGWRWPRDRRRRARIVLQALKQVAQACVTADLLDQRVEEQKLLLELGPALS